MPPAIQSRALCPLLAALAQLAGGCAGPQQGVAAVITDATIAAVPQGRLGDRLWRSFDGAVFPFTRWMPEAVGAPKAVIVAVHGLSGAADDFRPLGNYFDDRGVAVYSYELRGQGKDPDASRRGDIKSSERWFRDLDAFVSLVRREHPDVPVFLIGESLGSLILVNGVRELTADNLAAVRGIALTSPIIALRQQLGPIQNFFVHLLVHVVPWMKVSLEKLAGSEPVRVTSTTTHHDRMAVTAHHIDRFSLRLLGSIEDMIIACPECANALGKPLIIFYSGHDPFTAARDVEGFFDKLPLADKEKHFYPDGFHLLLHDKDAEDVLHALEAWIDRLLDGTAPAR